MTITIRTIPHAEQRYETCGDWWFDEAGDLHIRVSDMGSWEHEALVGVHETIEALFCKKAGIAEEAVSAFDIEFEKAREAVGTYPNIGEDASHFTFRGRQVGADAEPGDQDDAPYYKQHQLATAVERMMAAEMGVSWTAYEAACIALYD